jgi:hypothetical protein
MESQPQKLPTNMPQHHQGLQPFTSTDEFAARATGEEPTETRRTGKTSKRRAKSQSGQLASPDLASTGKPPIAVVLDEGRFKDSGQRDVLHQIFSEFESRPDGTPLVIHFHGGLVAERSAVEAAQNVLAPLYRDQGGGVPFAVVWRTGFWTSLADTLPQIFAEVLFSRVLSLLLKRLSRESSMLAIAGEDDSHIASFANLSFEEEQQFATDVANDGQLLELSNLIYEEYFDSKLSRQWLAEGTSLLTLADESLIREIRGIERAEPPSVAQVAGLPSAIAIGWRAAKALIGVGRRYATKRDHGLHATVMEELLRQFYLGRVGQDVWGTMKRYTDDAFAGPAESHGGSAIVEAISGLLAKGRRPRIVLVGHSAGAIFISKLLEIAADRLAPVTQRGDSAFRFEVILLAPAVRYDRFASALDRAEHLIGRFRMFTMLDTLEQQDTLIDTSGLKWVYPSSLLYFISGILEPDDVDMPLLGLHRHFENTQVYSARHFPQVQRVRDWLVRRPGRLVWSATVQQIPGLECTARDHAEFMKDDATRRSIVFFLTSSDVFAGTSSAVTMSSRAEADRVDESLLDSRTFTGRFLMRVPPSEWRTAQRTLRNRAGIASLERPEPSATIEQIADAGAAAYLPKLGIAVLAMSEDQYARASNTNLGMLATTLEPGSRIVRERFAYLAGAGEQSKLTYLDGFARGVQATIDAVRESTPNDGGRYVTPRTLTEQSVRSASPAADATA